MKIKICAIACFMGMAVTITSCTTNNMEKDYAAYVNPFITGIDIQHIPP